MHNYSDEDVKRALQYDALLEAENITQKSYKNDNSTGALGLELALRNNQAKSRMLQSRKDIYFGAPISYVRAVLSDMGFELALQDEFTDRNCDEIYELWVDPIRAILYEFESYGGFDRINISTYYYNMRFTSKNYYGLVSSGGFEKIDENGPDNLSNYVWCGYHDGRQGLRFHLEQVDKINGWQNPWVKPYSCFWLTTRVEQKKSDNPVKSWNDITKERMSRIKPQWARMFGF